MNSLQFLSLHAYSHPLNLHLFNSCNEHECKFVRRGILHVAFHVGCHRWGNTTLNDYSGELFLTILHRVVVSLKLPASLRHWRFSGRHTSHSGVRVSFLPSFLIGSNSLWLFPDDSLTPNIQAQECRYSIGPSGFGHHHLGEAMPPLKTKQAADLKAYFEPKHQAKPFPWRRTLSCAQVDLLWQELEICVHQGTGRMMNWGWGGQGVSCRRFARRLFSPHFYLKWRLGIHIHVLTLGNWPPLLFTTWILSFLKTSNDVQER